VTLAPKAVRKQTLYYFLSELAKSGYK
jgi:hypothetical protein